MTYGSSLSVSQKGAAPASLSSFYHKNAIKPQIGFGPIMPPCIQFSWLDPD